MKKLKKPRVKKPKSSGKISKTICNGMKIFTNQCTGKRRVYKIKK